MHPVVQKFIEGSEAQSRPYDLQPERFTAVGVVLEVSPDTSSDSPTAFRLSWPNPIDTSDLLYPLLLTRFVFGNDFDHVALMGRQAPVIQRGGRFTERIGAWTYTSHHSGGRWHMELSVA